jgi:hypothetical protein
MVDAGVELALVTVRCSLDAGLWSADRGSEWRASIDAAATAALAALRCTLLSCGPLTTVRTRETVDAHLLAFAAHVGSSATATAESVRQVRRRWA